MLDVRRPSSPSVARSELEGLDACRLSAGTLEALFVPAVGMVGASLRHEGEELLGQGEGLRAYRDAGVTMGIPFLHPWANRLEGDSYAAVGVEVELPPGLPRDDGGLPIHGVPPAAWEVRGASAGDGQARCLATLEGASAAFPFPHRLEQRITLQPSLLRIETTVYATSDLPVPVAFGFHPYLTLPGADRGDWVLGLPGRRELATDDRGLPSGATDWHGAEEAALGSRAFDHGYDALGPEPTFTLAGGGRRLTVRFLGGYPVAQVYAPRDQDVVCFEPMTAPTNALVTGRRLRLLPPDAVFRAAFEIRVGEWRL